MSSLFRSLGCPLGLLALLAWAGPVWGNTPPTLRITSPAANARFAPGAAVPLRVEAKDADGYAVHAVFYIDGQKVGEQSLNFIVRPPPGLTQVFEGSWIASGLGSRKFSVGVTDDQGAKADAGVIFQVGDEPQRMTLVKAGSAWRYNALNQDLGTAWVKREFSDQSWPVGPGQLGFGDGDEATKIPATEPRQPTVYFRRSFDVPADFGATGLIVRLLRDDGARVWLNGKPLVTDNLPDGEIKFKTLALGSAGEKENAWHEFRVSADLLAVGPNQLAVEVHQVNLTSSDLSFDLELSALVSSPPPGIPTVSLEAKTPITAEGCITCRIAPGIFTLRRTGDPIAPLSVWLAYSGTAIPGKDYGELPSRVEFPAGAATVDVYVGGLQDDLIEGPESVIATLVEPPVGSPTTYWIAAAHRRAEITINDSTPRTAPVVSIVATQPVTSEGCPTCLVAPGVFQLKRTGSTATALFVLMSYSGSATAGTDYEKLPQYVEIPAGKATKDLMVLPRYDQVLEGVETVVARIEPDPTDGIIPRYEVNLDHREAKVMINDAPDTGGSPVVSVSASRPEISECPLQLLCKIPPVDLIFHRTDARLSQPLTIFIRWSGDAIWGVDYRVADGSKPLSSVTFEAGSNTAKLQLSAITDCLIEDSEVAAVEILPDPTLGPMERYRVDSKASSAKVTLLDGSKPDEGIASVWIESGGPTLERCPTNARCRGVEFFVHRSGGRLTESLSVRLKYSGTATAGKDYSLPETTVNFQPGSDTASIVMGPLNDSMLEGDETVIATLECSANAAGGYRIVGAHASATVVIVDDESPSKHAVVELLEPKDGAAFTNPDSILIRARTLDPLGTMTTLTFYADEKKIGESNIVFIRAPDPGLPLDHEFNWKNPPAGYHKIYAVGADSTGRRVTSAAILVRVIRGDTRPIVTVKAGVAETREVPAGTKIAVFPATFILSRTGSTEKALRVVYAVSGSARNGRDYSRLDGDVTFAVGQSTREIQVVPLSDALVEDDETVELTLLKKDSYQLGSPGSARIVIHDAPILNPGSVTWQQPQDGSRWVAGGEIPLKVTVQDPSGYAVSVDFLANGKFIGSVPLILCLGLNCEPKPGAALDFAFPWKKVPAGEYALVAVAKGLQGQKIESAPVKVSVLPAEPSSFVTRDLPTAYRLGVALQVTLKAVPPGSARSYAVEDHPPKGWSVKNISHGGGWDASRGAVKFGPFVDGRERVLTYDVIPAGEPVLMATFAGEGSVNGEASRIVGDQTLAAERHQHPADTDPADWSISLNEATAYGAAWKSGAPWPVGPNPIPLDHVTRAGALWRGGEAYRFDASMGKAPLWWVNDRASGKPASLPDEDLAPAEWSAALQQVRERQSFVAATWFAAKSGRGLRVRTLPGEQVAVHALEIHLPTGASVGEVSDEGTYDAARGIIRWGPFPDGAPRLLTAQVNGAAVTGGSAQLSGDGQSISVPVVLENAPVADVPRIAEVRRLVDGSAQLFMVDEGRGGGRLEYSDDLEVWHRIGEIEPGVAAQVQDDTDANESPSRYYRAVRDR